MAEGVLALRLNETERVCPKDLGQRIKELYHESYNHDI